MDAHRRGRDDATAAGGPVNRSQVEVQAAPPSLIERQEEQRTGAPVDVLADVVEVTSSPAIERKSEETIGAALLGASADAAQVGPPSIIEHDDASTTRSVERLVVMMALLALGLVPFLIGRRYAQRVLAYAATRRSEARVGDARPVYLLCPPQIEADPDLVSNLEASMKKVLYTIKEAEAEIASSRQLRRSS
ncbi:hypothetical protein HZZ13_17165 [Bradyrhizobium sp. CNPSo 4010]|uniref:Uncharacterized protein n=1 Tax=Bradyrhizobium agreste TaxID=2751811 RepID=A0ABS0PR00_9BRAD|nr:hypothetical protein [Bradyrhizobium agreste]MBH5399500.1 hypothetical protein [Bradyrhizobium agreste]